MTTRGVAPDCKRVHFDLPADLYERIVSQASEPPKISVAEWCRRVVAWRVGYDLPSAAERREKGVRLTGAPKQRTGPKPKYLQAQEIVPHGTEGDDAA